MPDSSPIASPAIRQAAQEILAGQIRGRVAPDFFPVPAGVLSAQAVAGCSGFSPWDFQHAYRRSHSLRWFAIFFGGCFFVAAQNNSDPFEASST
jgi:hypothetical protein